jgi:uncharacterized protein YndB with AHSA1/START domain
MDRYVTHATFSLERIYPVPPARVFAAWADPAAKARWFAPGTAAGHQLDGPPRQVWRLLCLRTCI